VERAAVADTRGSRFIEGTVLPSRFDHQQPIWTFSLG
jgi:hypothetical protein